MNKERLRQFFDRAFKNRIVRRLRQIDFKGLTLSHAATKLKINPSTVALWADWAKQKIEKRGARAYGKGAVLLLSMYFLADITSTLLEGLIPSPPKTQTISQREGTRSRKVNLTDYNVVIIRNLFNSKGLIPGEEGEQIEDFPLVDGPPVKTSLPLNLIGTLIFKDPTRSLATIEDKSASQIYPVRITDEIPDKAEIISIESRRVVFINLMNHRREFIELPEDKILGAISRGPKKSTSGAGGATEHAGANQFNINRAEIESAMGDINKILTQARAVPNFENGQPSGYKLFQIVPGSIYEKLGFKNGDVVAGVNGEPMADPSKAFEMMNELKSSNHVEINVKRNGKEETFIYDIQ